MWNRLGVLTDEVSVQLTEALDWIKEQQLAHVEIRMVDGHNIISLSDEQVQRVQEEVSKRGLFISAIASPVFKCALDPSRPVASGDTFGQKEESVEAHFDKLQRSFEICKLLGTKQIRIFSFWREVSPQQHEQEIVGHLRTAAEMAQKQDIVLLLENEPSCNGGFASEVARLTQLVASPNLKVLWDPGNEEYGGRNSYPAGYKDVQASLGHVHLKDALIDSDGVSRCVPIGSGNVPFKEQLQALQADGYTGLFTIETHYVPAGGTAKDGTALTLEGLKTIIKEAGLD
ncbi:sugar phosphate isomerase/epimerase family protein [Paenibacillus senegalensis]|uniref:sugar phosphate isomerase/epimerase family protein n=1 Tax=Paenibacillus senegalensis TaxID=1465766 RepID=UPI00028A1CA4|nr:sugar phosphate isomerase/epimerase family protein [Paenibacillus senegalensis]